MNEITKPGDNSDTVANLQRSVAGTETVCNSRSIPSDLNPKVGRGLFSASDLAKQLGCDIRTITNHANRLFPGKIRNGVKTLYNDREATLILESIKRGQENQTTLKGSLQGVETALTPALKLAELTELIKRSYEQIDEIKTAEIARLNADLAATQQLLEYRTAGLATIQRIAEAGGLIMSDRDDIEATYRRGR
jgi:hypothetical protein